MNDKKHQHFFSFFAFLCFVFLFSTTATFSSTVIIITIHSCCVQTKQTNTTYIPLRLISSYTNTAYTVHSVRCIVAPVVFRLFLMWSSLRFCFPFTTWKQSITLRRVSAYLFTPFFTFLQPQPLPWRTPPATLHSPCCVEMTYTYTTYTALAMRWRRTPTRPTLLMLVKAMSTRTIDTTRACEVLLNRQSKACCPTRPDHNRGIDSQAAPNGGSAQGKYRMSSSSTPFIERPGKGPSVKVPSKYKCYAAARVQPCTRSLPPPSHAGGWLWKMFTCIIMVNDRHL